jgi:hypothetical protein
LSWKAILTSKIELTKINPENNWNPTRLKTLFNYLFVSPKISTIKVSWIIKEFSKFYSDNSITEKSKSLCSELQHLEFWYYQSKNISIFFSSTIFSFSRIESSFGENLRSKHNLRKVFELDLPFPRTNWNQINAIQSSICKSSKISDMTQFKPDLLKYSGEYFEKWKRVENLSQIMIRLSCSSNKPHIFSITWEIHWIKIIWTSFIHPFSVWTD